MESSQYDRAAEKRQIAESGRVGRRQIMLVEARQVPACRPNARDHLRARRGEVMRTLLPTGSPRDPAAQADAAMFFLRLAAALAGPLARSAAANSCTAVDCRPGV